MTAFRALVVTPSGRQAWEVVEADSRASAAARLSLEGFVPLDIRSAKPTLVERLNEPVFLSRRLGLSDQAMLLTQLSMLVRFGMPVDRSLDMLRDQASSGAVRDVLARAVTKVRGGEGLARTFADLKLFPAYAIGVLQAAERTGKLGDALDALAERMTVAASTRRQLITALTYPALVFVSTLVALAIVLTIVVPEFAPIFAGEEERLPTLTRWVLWIAEVVNSWGWLLLAGIGCLIVFGIWAVRAQDRSSLAAGVVQRMPLRKLRQQYQGAQLLGVLGTLLSNGLTVVDALPLTAQATRSARWAGYLRRTETAVRGGSSLSRALNLEPLLPTTAIRLLEVGERGGSLGRTCLQASVIMGEAAKARIDRFVALANPIAIITLGALVAMLVAGVMLGIFALGDFVE